MNSVKMPIYPFKLFFELEIKVTARMRMNFRIFITMISQKKLSSFKPM